MLELEGKKKHIYLLSFFPIFLDIHNAVIRIQIKALNKGCSSYSVSSATYIFKGHH